MSCRLHIHRWGDLGPLVVALHSSGLSGLQWRRLADKTSQECRLWAPDFFGYGKSPASPNGLDSRYTEDVDEVLALLDSVREPVLLFGHSYGGFIALKSALARPDKVRALCLYEPVVWGSLASFRGVPIEKVVARFDPDLILLDKSRAGTEEYLQKFIDYWNGPGSWEAMNPVQRQPVVAGAEKIAVEVYEVVTDKTPHTDYAALKMPIHILHGTVSPPEVLAMKDILTDTLPQLTTACIPGGHMNPIRNPLPVNAHFQLFLKNQVAEFSKREASAPILAPSTTQPRPEHTAHDSDATL